MTIIDKAIERKPEEIAKALHPLIKEWFFSKFADFSLTQKYGVAAIWERKNILISAPTGGTKTLTAFLSILNYLVMLSEKNELENKVYAVYISPLKALSNDIHKNLVEPLEEINKLAEARGIKLQKINVGLRTGDTTKSERVKMAKNAPHILITTPESLSIVLTSKKFVDYMAGVEFCIVDEIHALDNKRGTYLSLSLERLNEVSKIWPVKIGLSATISPLEEVAKFLVGEDKFREVQIAEVPMDKKIDIKVLTPVNNLVEDENINTEMYSLVDKLIQEHKTTLIFTNTRAGTERVVSHLKERFPTIYGEDNIAAHHSSLGKGLRFNIEERLRNGELRVVVCSTSLELGIDIGYIDLVIMLGSPKSSARALQRCLPYDSKILCCDGIYRKIGEIVKNKIDIKVISYDKNKGFVKNKILNWIENPAESLIKFKLENINEIITTKEHPILTDSGWKKAKDVNINDKIAEIRGKIDFIYKEPPIFELLPKDKIFVVNTDNFFQKIVDKYRKEQRINAIIFAKKLKMPYNQFIDCRRLKGRRKSIRLDYFINACKICNVPLEEYLPYIKNLKTKGSRWPKFPLYLNEEIMWLAGIIATDGCIVKSRKNDEAEYYRIKIGNKSRVMLDKIKEIILKYDIEPYIKFDEIRNFYNLEFGSNLFAYIFMSFGIPCKRKSYEIDINNVIFSLPDNLIYAYLEGIFEGDGNFNLNKTKTSGMIRLFTASENFAIGLHKLISRLGYENKVSKNKIKPSKLIKKVSDGYLYCIGIYRKESIQEFFQNIPCYGEKALKSKEATKNFKPYLSLREEYDPFITYLNIKEKTIIENKNPVYNLTLKEEPNNFIIDNIIVHNCGRAGHKLREVPKGRFIVMDRDDLVECCVIQKEMIEKKIDKIRFPKNCLDVLAQQIYGMTIYKTWDIEELFSLIKKSYCYSELSKNDFYDIISYLAGEYALEKNYIYGKIWYDPLTKMVGKRGRLARVIYLTNIGTIPEESFVTVKIGAEGEKIGVIDESFLERMKRGDVFVLGGSKYEYVHTRGMNLYVKPALHKNPTIPSWFSEMLPLSFDSALEINKFRTFVKERFDNKYKKQEIIKFIQEYLYIEESSAEAIYNYFYEQYRFLEIPNSKEIIIERFKGGKNYLLFSSMYGRRVNDALSRALGYLIGHAGGRDIEVGINDNGFYIAGEKLEIEKALKFLTPENLEEVLAESVERTDILARRFRHCATRSLMILRTYKGQSKSVGKQQMKSHFLLAAVRRVSKNFPILREARREVMQDLMDVENAKKVLNMIKSNEIKIKIREVKLPSPFAINLIIQGHTDLIKIEDKQAFLKRMHELHVKAIDGEKD